jgi:hypothetical protein
MKKCLVKRYLCYAFLVFVAMAVFSLSAHAEKPGKWIFKGDSAEGILPEKGYSERPPETALVKSYVTSGVAKNEEELEKKFGRYPFEQVKTSAGILTSLLGYPGNYSLYLNDKPLPREGGTRILQAYPEKHGLPSLVLVQFLAESRWMGVPNLPYIVDVGVSPPFISKDFIPVAPETSYFKGAPSEFNTTDVIDVQKKDDDTFIVSGLLFVDKGDHSYIAKDKKGSPVYASYEYNRRTRTVKRVAPLPPEKRTKRLPPDVVNPLRATSPNCSDIPPKRLTAEFHKWMKSKMDFYNGDFPASYKNRMFYCRGNTPETGEMIYITPGWRYAYHEDDLYPIEAVDTVAGVVTTLGSRVAKEIFLNGKPLISGFLDIQIAEACPEEKGKPKIVIATGEAEEDFKPLAPTGNFLIDFGVSPPFVSHEFLAIGSPFMEIGVPSPFDKDNAAPSGLGIQIKKIDADTYEFTGDSGEAGKATYRYSRKTRTLTKM